MMCFGQERQSAHALSIYSYEDKPLVPPDPTGPSAAKLPPNDWCLSNNVILEA